MRACCNINELIDRRRRNRLLRQDRFGFERQNSDDVGMENAEVGEKFEPVPARAMLSQNDIGRKAHREQRIRFDQRSIGIADLVQVAVEQVKPSNCTRQRSSNRHSNLPFNRPDAGASPVAANWREDPVP